jgi:hypothetical protein
MNMVELVLDHEYDQDDARFHHFYWKNNRFWSKTFNKNRN